FLVAFLAVLRVATFLVAALRTVFFAAFLVAFFATFFFATLAVFLAGALVAFLATFFFAAFFAAIGWLSSSVDLQYYCPVVKRHAGIGPVHTAGAPRAPERIRRGQRGRVNAVPVIRKHLRSGTAQVSGKRWSGFRSGDDAFIHLVEVRGGGLFCAARFRCVLTHSLLRQRLLGET